MLFELKPGAELQDVETELLEFNSASHPSLELVKLVLLFLEKSDFELADLCGDVEVQVSGVNQMDVALYHGLKEGGVLMEQEEFTSRNLTILV